MLCRITAKNLHPTGCTTDYDALYDIHYTKNNGIRQCIDTI